MLFDDMPADDKGGAVTDTPIVEDSKDEKDNDDGGEAM